MDNDVVNLLPGEQGDSLVASLANGVSIYANWPLPTYCMFTVRESDIVVSTVVITERMIEDFRCTDGRIGIVRYSRLERPLNRKSASGNNTSLHGSVFYGAPTPRPTYEALRGITRSLTIKTPKYVYQREYRIIGSQPVEWRLKSDENRPGCKIEEYGHVGLA